MSRLLIAKQTDLIELENCSFVKAVLMLLVIWGHCIAFWSGNWFTPLQPIKCNSFLNLLFIWVGSFHTYAFTLVSGFIFETKIMEGAYEKFSDFLKNKIKRLIIPYFFISIIWVVPLSLSFYKWDIKTIAYNYLLAESPSQLWFLWMLFWCFVFFWYVRNRSFIFYRHFPLVIICLWGVGIIGNKLTPNVFCFWYSLQYLIFFYIGMILKNPKICYWGIYIKKIKIRYWLILDVIIFIIKIVLEQSDIPWINGAILLINLLLHIVGAILSYELFRELARRIFWKKSVTMKILIQYSMPIYLLHQQIIYYSLYFFNGKINPFLHSVINFVLALGISLLISFLLSKVKFTAILLGISKR